MLVKKTNDQWMPIENPELKMDETIEMTDPKALILEGFAVGVDESTGADLSAFDLYGVIIEEEVEEFRKFQDMKKQEFLSEKLENENKELIKEAAQKKAKADIKKEEDKVSIEKAAESKVETAAKAMDWKEMIKKGTELGVYKVGMTKVALTEALKDA